MSGHRWPMCGRPSEYACDTCTDAGKPCYCDGDGTQTVANQTTERIPQ